MAKALLSQSCGSVDASPFDPEIYTGISMGAFNAAVMTSRADEGSQLAVGGLEKLWQERIAQSWHSATNGLYRFRLQPFDYLNPKIWLNPIRTLLQIGGDFLSFAETGLRQVQEFGSGRGNLPGNVMSLFDLSSNVDHSPFEALVRDTVEIGKIPLSKKQLRIIASNWEKGKPEVYTNDDFVGEMGYEALVGAGAILGLATKADEGVLFRQPLAPAIRAALESRESDELNKTDTDGDAGVVLHVVYLDPEITSVPPARSSGVMATAARLYTSAYSSSVNEDIARVGSLNDRLYFARYLHKDLDSNPDARQVLDVLSRDLCGKIELTIHRYCPSDSGELFNLFNFDRYQIERLIETGYNDALNHECARARCICPSH